MDSNAELYSLVLRKMPKNSTKLEANELLALLCAEHIPSAVFVGF